MPTPTNRTPVRVARGTYSNLNSSVSDIQEGEICYATDQDILYVKEGSSLVNASHQDISGKADLAGPTFTGVPAAPTASSGTNTTQIATTAFVTAAVPDISGKADLAGPTFTGTPAAPTAAQGTNTTQLATTAFVVANALPLTGGTLTGDVTFDEAISIERVKEKATITNVNTSGTVNFDVKTQAILYHTGNSNGTFTLNMRGDGSTTLDSIMSVNDVLTVVFVAPQNSASYYCTAIVVDGVTPSTIKWVGGAPTSGNSSSVISSYTVSIFKTAAATFTVLANLTDYE